MPDSKYGHLADYFCCISRLLSVQAGLCVGATHTGDIGYAREVFVNEFLRKHLARRLHASLGGQIFGLNQPTSRQLDVIVTNDIGMQLNEYRKTFCSVESVAAVISVKTTLDKKSLWESLEEFKSIPNIDKSILRFKGLVNDPLSGLCSRFPQLVVFAYRGIKLEAILRYIEEFYKDNPGTPAERRPKHIVVNGKYEVDYSLLDDRVSSTGQVIPNRTFFGYDLSDDKAGLPLARIVHQISDYVSWLPFMDINDYVYTKQAFGI